MAALQWGQQVQSTGRGTRRLDYIWVSPELLPWIQRNQVFFDQFPDYVAVMISFANDFGSRALDVWIKPKQFPWPETWSSSVRFDASVDSSVAYRSMWERLEIEASQVV